MHPRSLLEPWGQLLGHGPALVSGLLLCLPSSGKSSEAFELCSWWGSGRSCLGVSSVLVSRAVVSDEPCTP